MRTAKAMGLRNLPAKTWSANTGWVLAANLAADLVAWTRLLGLFDHDDLVRTEPAKMHYRLWHIPRRARERRHEVHPASGDKPGDRSGQIREQLRPTNRG